MTVPHTSSRPVISKLSTKSRMSNVLAKGPWRSGSSCIPSSDGQVQAPWAHEATRARADNSEVPVVQLWRELWVGPDTKCYIEGARVKKH